jgi:hypothetical protein
MLRFVATKTDSLGFIKILILKGYSVLLHLGRSHLVYGFVQLRMAYGWAIAMISKG